MKDRKESTARHRVFLSYATEDRDIASRVCRFLEAEGICCWLPSREGRKARTSSTAVLQALRDADLVLLIFSASANSSPYVLREVERAVAYERPVLSVHVDDAVPNPSLEYYLNLWQWIDGSGKVEDKRAEIVAAVLTRLASPGAAAINQSSVPVADAAGQKARTRDLKGSSRRLRSRRGVALITASAVLAAAGLGLGLGLGLTHGGETWMRVTIAGAWPDARFGQGIVYDSTDERLLMFGGAVSEGLGGRTFGDIWAYDPGAGTWTELKPAGAAPTARSFHAMVYDSAENLVIVFGGVGTLDSAAGSAALLNDTWAYDAAANTWHDLQPSGAVPSPRDGHGMVYDPVSHRVIMFGGFDGSGAGLGDTWAYDPGANTWTELRPSGDLPSARGLYSLASDPADGRVFVFGGATEGGVINDMWTYDPAVDTWAKLPQSVTWPAPRYGASMTYDASTRRLVMFGGSSSSEYLQGLMPDTWTYDPATHTWDTLQLVGSLPLGRFLPAMAYVPTNHQIVMFGGDSLHGTQEDLWILK